MSTKGIIGLDIDGTITAERISIPSPVISYLDSLASDGWKICFITGRPYKWAYSTLKDLPFDFSLAVQNGAVILEMPTKRVLSSNYLSRKIIPEMEEICQDSPSDFVIYAGVEFQDNCYFRSRQFDEKLLEYVTRRYTTLGETWHDVESFHGIPVEGFASLKCFGDLDSSQILSRKIESRLGLHAPVISDTFDNNYKDSYVVQVTRSDVNKGTALKQLAELFDCKGLVIAAGDDRNDRSMLEFADRKIVMATAPDEMHEMADVIAPSAEENGIIEALKRVIE